MTTKRKAITTAVTGSRREALVALRDLLAESLEQVDPQFRSGLARQLRDVLADIDTLPDEEVSTVDDLVARRTARRAAAATAASSP